MTGSRLTNQFTPSSATNPLKLVNRLRTSHFRPSFPEAGSRWSSRATNGCGSVARWWVSMCWGAMSRRPARRGPSRPASVAADLAPRARPDWDASYTYQRWQPAFYVAAQDRTSLFDAVASSGARVPVAQREQTVDAGVWRPFRRVRWAHTALAAYHVERLTTDTASTSDTLTRAGVRTAWTFTSARRYGYSISQEDGVTLAAHRRIRPARSWR